jgi:putative DNA primase/helicase
MTDVAETAGPFAPLTAQQIGAPIAAAPSDGELVLPVPAHAPARPQTHFALGDPSACWAYRDAHGALIFEVLRFDKADGSKEFWPLSLWRDANGLRWRWRSVCPPRPLYHLDGLAARPDAAVVVCEGEKAADAAARLFPQSVAVTSPGGAHAADKADWTVLRGREVLLWPDADAPGRHYAAQVAATLAALACDVSIIDADALARIAPAGGMREPSEEGWDAANAIAEWPDLSALCRAAMDCAKLFHVPDYMSFGDFEMSDAGLYRTITQGYGGNAKTSRCAYPQHSKSSDAGAIPTGEGGDASCAGAIRTDACTRDSWPTRRCITSSPPCAGRSRPKGSRSCASSNGHSPPTWRVRSQPAG